MVWLDAKEISSCNKGITLFNVAFDSFLGGGSGVHSVHKRQNGVGEILLGAVCCYLDADVNRRGQRSFLLKEMRVALNLTRNCTEKNEQINYILISFLFEHLN